MFFCVVLKLSLSSFHRLIKASSSQFVWVELCLQNDDSWWASFHKLSKYLATTLWFGFVVGLSWVELLFLCFTFHQILCRCRRRRTDWLWFDFELNNRFVVSVAVVNVCAGFSFLSLFKGNPWNFDIVGFYYVGEMERIGLVWFGYKSWSL